MIIKQAIIMDFMGKMEEGSLGIVYGPQKARMRHELPY